MVGNSTASPVTETQRTVRWGVVASLAAATLWIVLAWRTPTSTHHFAPMVVAGIWGYLERNSRPWFPSNADRAGMFVGGLTVAATAQVVLTVADKLQGPPLLSAVAVPVELAIMALIGATIGAAPWRRTAPGSNHRNSDSGLP